LIPTGGSVYYDRLVADALMALTLSLISGGSNLDALSQKFGEDGAFKNDFDATVPGFKDLSDTTVELPSWCPDWSLRPHRADLQQHYLRLKDLVAYNACAGVPAWCGTVEAEIKSYSRLGPLLLRGFDVDVVSKVGTIRRASWQSEHDCLQQWYEMLMKHQESFDDTYPVRETSRDVFWMVLYAGIVFQTKGEGSFKEVRHLATTANRIIFEAWAKISLRSL
jgi:hypothetical protein